MNIAIITGASSGMGRDFVYAIDKEFTLDEIWVIARREERLLELQKDCRTKIRPIALDLAVSESYEVYRTLLEEVKPSIQVLINAAGFGLFGDFSQMNLDKQLNLIDLNIKGLTAITHISLPYMPVGSHLLNLASNSSWQPVPYINVYGSSKAYVMNFSRALEMELKKREIHVMAIAPHWIKTEFFNRAVQDDTIKYYDRFYTSQQVVDKAMRDLRKRKSVSIMGFPVRMQVRLVKLLPVKWVMGIWCKQQGK
ncbi:MAG: SDR family NAD(P)-dependent oxidoreductase [Faecalimonas sp.]|nr:SDR family NAD(P)-dependent oxidoreductase [Faecalimonas sp.]